MTRAMVAFAIFTTLITPAFASQCPQQMAKIDQAMMTAQMTENVHIKVMDLRAAGEKHHTAGNHSEAEASLKEAMKQLGI